MKRLIFGILVLAAAGSAAWLGLRSSSQAADSFRLVPVERGSVEQTVTTTGALEPIVTVQVGTQVSGQVSEILADFNDPVTEGQVIARIDPTSLKTAVAQAKISLRKAAADLADRQREVDRIRGLHDRELAADIDLTAANYQLEIAQAANDAARLDLERAEQNLGYATIRAPISGIVVERSVDVGQTVAASLSAPQLFILAGDLAKMRILASVDESDVGLVAVGQKARFTVQAYPNQRFDGVVRQIRLQPSLQDNVVSYTAVIEVNNEAQPLLPGMTATVDILVAVAEDVLTLPNAAIRYRPSEELLARARENSQKEWGGHPDGNRPGASGADSLGGSGKDRSARRDTNGAGREGSGRSRAGGRGAGGANRTFVIYIGADGEPRIAPYKPGITDGQTTAIESPALEAGMSVVAGVTAGGSVANGSEAPGNPFSQGGGSSQSGGHRRPGGF